MEQPAAVTGDTASVLITLTTTYRPATDLGHLLHKHPDAVRSFEVSAGVAQVFFPEATEERCTAALLLEVDPVGMTRGRRGPGADAFTLGQYVNDRPYAASSLLAVALGKVFGTAMKGRCDARPELACAAIPLRLRVPALPCRGGPALVARLFGPLGWSVRAEPVPLDPAFPAWGPSRYVSLELAGTLRLADALNHLYVLLPVLDDGKHYWVGPDEVDKLVRAGGAAGGWLAGHPDRALITERYLAHRRPLAAEAERTLARLAGADGSPPDAFASRPGQPGRAGAAARGGAGAGTTGGTADGTADGTAKGAADGHDAGDGWLPSLAGQRRDAILAELRSAGAHRVLDLGCGEGRLMADLLADPSFTEIVGCDVSPRSLDVAARRLRLDRPGERAQTRVRLIQGALTYTDDRLVGYDAAVLAEVIEHIDPPRLDAVARAVFGHAQPGTVVVTTPNAEYNVRWDALPAGQLRHPDHRFEWSRADFASWAHQVADRYGYLVRLLPVGPPDPAVGPATQLAAFSRAPASTDQPTIHPPANADSG
jgi:SAM-dependent methyltransferase